MLWFKHRSDARNSLKLRKVRRKYGADGYAIYWFCLEAIAYDVDKDNLTFELKEDAETIAFELSIQEKRVEEIMLYMIKVGLFESSSNMITCMKLAESIDKSMTNSPKMRAWLDTQSVMTCADDVKTCAELEVEVEIDKKKNISKVDSIDHSAVVEIFNRVMVRSPKVVKLNEKRKRMVRNLFKFGELDLVKFESYLSYLHSTPSWNWAFEKRTGANQVHYKECSFEYFMKEDTYLKAKEEI